MKEVETIFKLLEDWCFLPKYQLERRLDIFLAVYLPELLEKEVGIKINYEDIIPEFPLKQKDSNRSNNADYAIFYKETEKKEIKLLLIELKTDMHSIRNEQIKYYKENKEKSTYDILSNLIRIYKHTKKEYLSKYQILLDMLENKELIIKGKKLNKRSLKYGYEVNKKFLDTKSKAKIIYIAPKENETIKKSSDTIITFEQIIKLLENKNNDVAKKMKKLLLKIRDNS